MEVLKGLSVYRGIAIGKIFKFSSEPLREKTLLQKLSREFHDLDLKDIGRIKVLRDSFYQKITSGQNVESEVKNFRLVLKQSKKDLLCARKKLSRDLSDKFSEIIDFQILALKDSNICQKTVDLIRDYGISAYLAVSIIFNERIELLRKNDKNKFRNRTYDLVDLYNRLISSLKPAAVKNREHYTGQEGEDLILVSRKMFPTDLAKIDLKRVRGIVIERQNTESHTSILIKSLRIPYMIKIQKHVEDIPDDQKAILDGFGSKLIICPDRDTEKKYLNYLKSGSKKLPAGRKKFKKIPTVLASINTLEEARSAADMGVSGIGLFRTELSFLNGDIGLSVSDQFEAYSNILRLFPGKPVTLRTLDLSGEKQAFINLFYKESLAAGKIRVLTKKIYSNQLEAMVGASKYGDLTIAFPMISKADDMISFKNQIISIQDKIKENASDISSTIPVSAFIETPAAVFTLGAILEETDIINIGTNDLLSLVYAESRHSDQLTGSDDFLQPPTISILIQIIDLSRKKHKKVTVCGAIAANPKFLPILVGMGVDNLSVELKRYEDVRAVLGDLNPRDCKELVSRLKKLGTKREIINTLSSF